MIRRAWAVLPWCVLLLRADDGGARAQYIGGTAGALAGKPDGRITLTEPDELRFQTRRSQLRILYRRIHTLEYGQRVNRRYAEAVLISPLLLLSKSRKHFLTIGYADEGGVPQAAVFQVNKHDIRFLLAALEARTGRKVQYQDDEARRSGQG